MKKTTLAIGVGAALLLAMYVPASTEGQGRITGAMALHRLCTNEVTWNTETADCDGIHAVLSFRMEHIPAYAGDSLADAADRYSGGHVTRPTRSRPWVSQLQPTCEEPRDWNQLLVWTNRHEYGCRRMYRRVLDILRGERDWVVRSPVHDWGASSISEQYIDNNPDARPARFALPTRNQFWELERYTMAFGS